MSNRLDQEREQRLTPKRMEFAKNAIEFCGHEIYDENSTSFRFMFKGSPVIVYPYSGWFSGKTVEDGRGISKLIKQIR